MPRTVYFGKAAEDYIRIQDRYRRSRFPRLARLIRNHRVRRLRKQRINQRWRKFYVS